MRRGRGSVSLRHAPPSVALEDGDRGRPAVALKEEGNELKEEAGRATKTSFSFLLDVPLSSSCKGGFPLSPPY